MKYQKNAAFKIVAGFSAIIILAILIGSSIKYFFSEDLEDTCDTSRLTRNIQELRDGKYTQYLFAKTKNSIARCGTILQKIGTDETEFRQLSVKSVIAEFSSAVKNLRIFSYEQETADYLINEIKKAVRKGEITFSNIETDESELDILSKKTSIVKELRRLIASLHDDSKLDNEGKRKLITRIHSAIDGKEVSWKDLRITREQLDQFVPPAKTR